MSAPWPPPSRPERPRWGAGDDERLAAVMARLGVAEAELDRLEDLQRARRRAFWVAFVVGVLIALVLF